METLIRWDVLGIGGSDGKASACNAGDLGSIPGLGRSPGEGNGNPLQYSCLENSMDRGAQQATVHQVTRVRHNSATKSFTSTTVGSLLHFFSCYYWVGQKVHLGFS